MSLIKKNAQTSQSGRFSVREVFPLICIYLSRIPAVRSWDI